MNQGVAQQLANPERRVERIDLKGRQKFGVKREGEGEEDRRVDAVYAFGKGLRNPSDDQQGCDQQADGGEVGSSPYYIGGPDGRPDSIPEPRAIRG